VEIVLLHLRNGVGIVDDMLTSTFQRYFSTLKLMGDSKIAKSAFIASFLKSPALQKQQKKRRNKSESFCYSQLRLVCEF
jgi:hypothetical protein